MKKSITAATSCVVVFITVTAESSVLVAIAATVVLMTGFVGGGAYLMTDNKESKRPENVTQQFVTKTTAANTTATITTFETEDIRSA